MHLLEENERKGTQAIQEYPILCLPQCCKQNLFSINIKFSLLEDDDYPHFYCVKFMGKMVRKLSLSKYGKMIYYFGRIRELWK